MTVWKITLNQIPMKIMTFKFNVFHVFTNSCFNATVVKPDNSFDN